MKVKKYLSVLAVACAGALTLAGCSDYDNGYNEAAIKFQEEFKNTFGDIDPEQDWNLAERATVTVNTQTTSNIKIYSLVGDEYAIVGNYEGVNGTQMLGVDILEGTRSLIVSDGMTAQTCAPGDVVVFSPMTTRTTYEGTEGKVTVTKLDGPTTIGDVEYPQYVYATTEAELKALTEGVIPEIGHRDTYTNLNKVTHDFSYVSTGSFIIYPYYWNTSSYNTIGIYYYEGNQRIEKDIYKCKEGDELKYEDAYDGQTLVYDEYQVENWEDKDFGLWNRKITPADWSINNGITVDNFHYNGWSGEDGISSRFIEYWRSGSDLANATISRNVTGLEPGNYVVEIDARIMKELDENVDPKGVTFFANNQTYDLHNLPNNVYTNPKNTNQKSAYRSGNIYLDVVTVNSDGKLNVGFNVNNANVNWLAFKNLKVSKMGTWKDAVAQGKNTVRRGQGIQIDIEPGIKFGMYLKKTDTFNDVSHSYQFFSESELNDPSKVGSGVTDDGQNNSSSVQLVEGSHPCYASTFHVGDQMFIGFEDWPNDANESDFDLNDLVLAFAGATPTIINEDPEPAATWMLACEDLGGTFDTDYNDVVFTVEHLSGQEFAIVTPRAAGGTLATYIFYEHPTTGAETCLGEIHQLFGFAPAVSGEYESHNAGVSRGTPGSSVTIQVPTDWSMAIYSTETFAAEEGDYNMGGFQLRTLKPGEEDKDGLNINSVEFSGASRIPAPDLGAAPYIICLPYSYVENNKPSVGWKTETFWAWPREFMNINGCYPNFPLWVSDHSTNGDWYKNKREGAPTVSEYKIETPMGNSPVLQPSDLTYIQSDLYINRGGDPKIDENVRTSSNGNITYHLDSPNGSVWQTGQTLWQAGDRTVYVSQEADGNYAAGTTQFVVHIAKDNTTLNVQNDNTTVGTGFDLRTLVTSTNSDANITYKIYNGDYWVNENDYLPYVRAHNESYVFTPDRPGTLTIKISQAENNNFNASGEKTCTLTVTEAQTQPTTLNYVLYVTDGSGNKWSPFYAYSQGLLQKPTNTYDSHDQWQLEPAGDGYYYMYNVAANKYLHLSSSNSYDAVFQDDKPIGDHNGKFKIVEVDGGIALLLKSKESAGNPGFMGYDELGNEKGIYLNKGVDKRFVFSIATPNTNLAKQRRVNKK